MNRSSSLACDASCGNVAFFLGYGWLGVSTPPLICAMHLADRGWHVDVYAHYHTHCDRMGICRPALTHPNITFIYDNMPFHEATPVMLPGNRSIPEAQEKAVQIAAQRSKIYDWVMGFDPAGLVQAAAFSLPRGIPFIYHSLELQFEKSLVELEKYCSAFARFCIIQDDERAKILSQINHIDRNKIFVLPNSSSGEIIELREDYFREMFPDIGSRHIVLACGTLLPDCCIHEILAASVTWPEDVTLVLHGWLPETSFKQTVERFVLEQPNVFLSQKILPPAEKFRIFQSVDICLAFYASHTDNLKFAAGASGKLYDAMRCGTPIIGNDIPGMAALLHDTGCGIVVPDAKGIAPVLPVLIKHWGHFRKKCFATFPRYEFSGAFDRLLCETGLQK